MQRRRIVGLTGFGGERAPAAVAVEEDVVAELLVLLRRPQALPVVGLGLVARLAPHCRRMPPPSSDSEQGEAADEQSREGPDQREISYTPSEWSALGSQQDAQLV